MANEQPVWKKSLGALRIAAWKNTVQINGRDVERLSVRVERRYKDSDDRWQSTNSYSVSELFRMHCMMGNSLEELAKLEQSQRGDAA